jgi:hypothetical protein
MNAKTEAFQKEVADAERKYRKWCFLSCATELQFEACENLELLKKEASALKKEVVDLNDEDSANALLACEEMIGAIASELKMWIALKNDDAQSAWRHLIEVQGATRSAMQAHSVAHHLQDYIDRLYIMELILFPPQIFFSPGMKVVKASCSICGHEYGECTHVKSKPYMGELCVRHIEQADLQEVSFVPEPANKGARAFAITGKDGLNRNTLTGRIIP